MKNYVVGMIFVFALKALATSAFSEEKSLYERLGGSAAITAVVEDFVARTAANPEVNFTRKGAGSEWEASESNLAILKKHLI